MELRKDSSRLSSLVGWRPSLVGWTIPIRFLLQLQVRFLAGAAQAWAKAYTGAPITCGGHWIGNALTLSHQLLNVLQILLKQNMSVLFIMYWISGSIYRSIYPSIYLCLYVPYIHYIIYAYIYICYIYDTEICRLNWSSFFG